MPTPYIERRLLILLFIFSVAIRYTWAYLSGVDNFSLHDWTRYDGQSDEILRGNFNLETDLFITAPLFSYTVALLKFVFGDSFESILELCQIVLSSVSVIYLCLTANVLFRSNKVSLLVGVTFSLYPITLYWVHVFGQETFFQAFLIIGLYYFTRYFRDGKSTTILLASIVLSLALLTKSHILLAFPFFALSLIATSPKSFDALRPIGIMIITILIITAPYGIYNKITNGTYVISSSGGGGYFLTGHNEDIYTYIVSPPLIGTEEHKRLASMDFYVFRDLAPKLQGLSHAEKQSLYFKTGLDWAKSNIEKSIVLAGVNLKNFLKPGFHKGHQDPKLWMISFLLALPVFVLAYFEIARSLINDWKSHTQIASLFLAMGLFSILFYSQNRFRVITIEPWYLMYGCNCLIFIFQRLSTRKSTGREQKVGY